MSVPFVISAIVLPVLSLADNSQDDHSLKRHQGDILCDQQRRRVCISLSVTAGALGQHQEVVPIVLSAQATPVEG